MTNNDRREGGIPTPDLIGTSPSPPPGMTAEDRDRFIGPVDDGTATFFDEVDIEFARGEQPAPGNESDAEQTAVLPTVNDDTPPPAGPTGFDTADPDEPGDRKEKLPGWAKVGLALLVILALLSVVVFVSITMMREPGGGAADRERTVTTETGGEGEGEQGTGGYASPDAIEEPEDSRPADPMFSWWGDRLSANSLRYSPSIGTAGHSYFWHADEEVRSAGEVINDIEASRIAEERGEPDEDLGTLGGTVVFAYGNTEDVDAGTLGVLRDAVGEQRTLVLVGIGGLNNHTQPWKPELNERYRTFAEDNVNTRYVDWQSEVDSNPDYVTDDGNLTQSGTSAWANLVNQEIADIYNP